MARENELYHYGVKGMRWGVRRDRSDRIRKLGSKAKVKIGSAANKKVKQIKSERAKARVRKQKVKLEKQRIKDATAVKLYELKAQQKLERAKSKGAEKAGATKKVESPNGVTDGFAGRKNLKQLSDSDLNKAINRLNQEKQYKQLVKELTPKTKGDRAKDLAVTVGTKLGNKLIEKGTEEAASRIMNIAKQKIPGGAAAVAVNQAVSKKSKGGGGVAAAVKDLYVDAPKQRAKDRQEFKLKSKELKLQGRGQLADVYRDRNNYKLKNREMDLKTMNVKDAIKSQQEKRRDARAEARNERAKDWYNRVENTAKDTSKAKDARWNSRYDRIEKSANAQLDRHRKNVLEDRSYKMSEAKLNAKVSIAEAKANRGPLVSINKKSSLGDTIVKTAVSKLMDSKPPKKSDSKKTSTNQEAITSGTDSSPLAPENKGKKRRWFGK